jgi:hypothetical protein
MTIKRGGDGTKGTFPSRPRDTVGGAARDAQRTQATGSTRQAPEPLSTSLDGFDSDPPSETRVTGSGSTAVDELFREARGRPSLLSSMSRVLDDTRKKLESELQVLRDEASLISANPALTLDDKIVALADVRTRMEKPRRRLISIRRRTRTSVALAARDHDGANRRAKAAFVRAQSASSSTEHAFGLATVASELKLPSEASAAGGALRIGVDGVAERASFGLHLVHQAPSIDDAFALLSLLAGGSARPQGSTRTGSGAASSVDTDRATASSDGTDQLLSRLHDVRST